MTSTVKFSRPAAVCARVGIGRTKLYELIAAGLIHAVKSGSATLVDIESVDAWAAALPPVICSTQSRKGMA